MSDLFQDSAASEHALSRQSGSTEGERSGRSERTPLSVVFTALADRFDKIERHETMRDEQHRADRTVSLLQVLKGVFPDAWERVRVAEMIDRCPARRLMELVGSRSLAEKIADALRFPVGRLN
jgi:hypothetical protein